MARLLLLEDDDGIRTSLRLALEDEGYEVAEASRAEDALSLLRTNTPDLMLVDLMLGGMDGFTFIRRARPESDAPIIVISARSDTVDIVAALEAGADDYVTKPFVLNEVIARLRALMRRGPGSRAPGATAVESSGEDAVAGDDDPTRLVLDARDPRLVLDMGAGTVRRGEDDIHLTVTEYRVLCELASPPGRVRSRGSLLDAVWDRGFFGDERIVDVHIRRLRTKVELDASHPGARRHRPRARIPAGPPGKPVTSGRTRFGSGRDGGGRTGRRLGLRATITAAFAVGGLLLAATMALGTYLAARHYLVDQRERTALRQAYTDASFVRDGLLTIRGGRQRGPRRGLPASRCGDRRAERRSVVLVVAGRG